MSARRSAPRGQNFLVDAAAAQKIVEAARCEGEEVLEIGPGRGALTRLLCEKARRVVAVEMDRRLAETLARSAASNQVGGARLEIVSSDFLDVPPTDLAPPAEGFVVVANLPYCAATPALFRLLDGEIPWKRAVLMFQAEVADRLCASEGTKDFGLLTVMAASAARVEPLFDLPPGAFSPRPRVHSRVLSFTPRSDAPDAVTRATLSRIARRAFAQRRKQLGTSLAGLSWLSETLAGLGRSLRDRPESLSVATWITLARRAEKD